VAFWLKLIALLHPARLTSTSCSTCIAWMPCWPANITFTQKFVGGVEMPYAIGLYLFAGLWTWITSDHMALIRGGTVATDVVAGALLYPLVLRAWGQRRTAVLAVLAYQLPPLAFGVLGNANLANIFGQSMALVVMAAAVTWSLAPRRIGSLLAFAAVLAWALASHCQHGRHADGDARRARRAVLLAWRLARRRSSVAIVIAMLVAAALAWFAFLPRLHERVRLGVRPHVRRQPVTDRRARHGGRLHGTTERVRDLIGQAGVQRRLAAADSRRPRRHRPVAIGRA
jgi:hypothetical protein